MTESTFFRQRFINTIAAEGLTGPWIEKIADRLFADLDFLSTADEHFRLVAILHEKQNHPDYEYDTTETGRKSGADPREPEGNGWKANIHKGRNGFERFDFTEEYYWLRLKSDAAADNLLPQNVLKPIELNKVDLAEYLTILREMINKEYMASSSKEGFNSKPEYTKSHYLFDLHYGTGFYVVDTIQDCGSRSDLKNGDLDLSACSNLHEVIWFAIAETNMSSHPGFQILTNLKNDQTFIRIPRVNGTQGDWVRWYEFTPLPLNTAAIFAAFHG